MFQIFTRLRRRGSAAALAVLMVLPGAALAAEGALPTLRGQVILTVSGAIGTANSEGEAAFDRDMLAALPQHEIRTTTEWTDGVKVFRGPLVSDLLAAAGASGDSVVATALNDYSVEIPLRDFADYPAILAMSMDGVPLTVRTKGPLWIVYPRDDYKELQKPEMNSRWIWQLRSLEIR